MKKILFTAFSLFFISVVAFAQFRIDVPELVGPDDGEIDQMPNVTLDWSAILNATGYHVMVSMNENFNNPIVDEVVLGSGFENTYLMFNTTYYWRVRAVEGENFSDWSDTRSFTTFEKLELKDPGNGDDGEEAEVVLKWEKKPFEATENLSGFDKYQIQVDLDSTHFNSNPEWNIMMGYTVDVWQYTLNYAYYGDTMYWRMRAIHPHDTSDWSATWSFITDPQVTLDKPNNGSTNTDLDFNIQWKEYKGTIEYEYQVHPNASFNGALTYFLDSTEVPVPVLKYGTEYYWRVRAKNTRDTTIWSEVWNFTTANTVTQLEPLNMADSVALNPTLSWEPIVGSETYDVQYSTDSTFAENTSANIKGANFTIGTTLLEDTKYFWRARACAPNDTSAYSEPWSFTTLGAIGIEEYFTNESLSVFPNPASDFATLNIEARKEGVVNYSLTDLTGKELQSGIISLVTGKNSKQLNLKGMAKGIYLINLEMAEDMVTRKLIIK